MAWYEDLAACNYFGLGPAQGLRAVGWLERGQPYPVGRVEPGVFDRLAELARDPWQPATAAGPHPCDLCLYRAEAWGTANLFVPGDGVLYVCPELVIHYMNAHGYAPPPEFCRAVLACPTMRSVEYLKRVLESGGRPLVRSARPFRGDKSEV
jgi:hypothetical protein